MKNTTKKKQKKNTNILQLIWKGDNFCRQKIASLVFEPFF